MQTYKLVFFFDFLALFCIFPQSVLQTLADLLVISAFYQRGKGGANSVAAALCLMSTKVTEAAHLLITGHVGVYLVNRCKCS